MVARYQRSGRAFVSALAETFIAGSLPRSLKAIAEGLCGHAVSASTVSTVNGKLDEDLERFARRPLEEPCPYRVLGARYEKIREDSIIRSREVLIAIGINRDGRRYVLGVELANRESASSWKDFLVDLRQRGLGGVEFVVSDDLPGLRRAIVKVLPEAVWQRCYVYFLRNANDHLPRRGDDDCLQGLRWIHGRRTTEEARRVLAVQRGENRIEAMRHRSMGDLWNITKEVSRTSGGGMMALGRAMDEPRGAGQPPLE